MKLSKVKSILLLTVILTLSLITCKIAFADIAEDNLTNLHNQQEQLQNILIELDEIIESNFEKIDKSEDNLSNLKNEEEYLLYMLTELDVLVQVNYEKNKRLIENVNQNTDKLIEESDMYITILEEIDVLNKEFNQKSNLDLVYEYDEENKLKVIKNKSTNMIIYEFEYDENGNLIKVKKH